MANELPTDVMRIVLDNRDPPPAELVLAWATATVAHFRRDHGLEAEQVIIRNLGLGTTTLELWFLGIGALGGTLVAVSAVGLFATAYVAKLRGGDRAVAMEAVQIIDRFNGSHISVAHGTAEPVIVKRGEIEFAPVTHKVRVDSTVKVRPEIGTSEVSQASPDPPLYDESPWDAPTFSNIPAFADETIVSGMIVQSDAYHYLVQEDGAKGVIESIQSQAPPPVEELLNFRVTAVRGERGGWADRQIRIIDWWPKDAEPATDPTNKEPPRLPSADESNGPVLLEGAFVERLTPFNGVRERLLFRPVGEQPIIVAIRAGAEGEPVMGEPQRIEGYRTPPDEKRADFVANRISEVL